MKNKAKKSRVSPRSSLTAVVRRACKMLNEFSDKVKLFCAEPPSTQKKESSKQKANSQEEEQKPLQSKYTEMLQKENYEKPPKSFWDESDRLESESLDIIIGDNIAPDSFHAENYEQKALTFAESQLSVTALSQTVQGINSKKSNKIIKFCWDDVTDTESSLEINVIGDDIVQSIAPLDSDAESAPQTHRDRETAQLPGVVTVQETTPSDNGAVYEETQLEPMTEKRKMFVKQIIEKFIKRAVKFTKLSPDNLNYEAIIDNLLDKTWEEIKNIDFDIPKRTCKNIPRGIFYELERQCNSGETLLFLLAVEDPLIEQKFISSLKRRLEKLKSCILLEFLRHLRKGNF